MQINRNKIVGDDYQTSPDLMPRQPNKSLIDGLKVLQFAISYPQGVGVNTIATELGIDTTKVHRLLRTLAAGGYLRQIKGRKYVPDAAIAVLAAQAMQGAGFVDHVYPILDELHKSTGMLVAYGMLWNRQVTYLYHAKPGIKAGMGLAGHTLVDATQSRLGLAMLARLSQGELELRYTKKEIPGFSSFKELLGKLKMIQENGYIYEKTNTKGDKTVAICFEKKPAISIAIAGKINKSKVDFWVKRLRDIETRIETPRML
ncbi:MAG: DNA-binding IclR family transcriptional regulator [Candidatus Azotimanducaceae bacterium]|jgi:DNA-binding IclR family transcriptional regulator